MHAAVAHTSPYMSALTFWLNKAGYQAIYVSNIYEKFYEEGERAYIYLHRLGRMYNNLSSRSADDFINRLKFLKIKGFKLLWTIHNFYPLTVEPNFIDKTVIINVGQLADCVFSHTETMRKNAEILLGRKVINHGYGTDFKMDEDKSRFGNYVLNSVFTLGFLGNIRSYKNIEMLLEVFFDIEQSINNLHLLIAGPYYDNYSREFLQSVQHQNTNIHVVGRFVSDPEKFAKYVDTFVCTYDVDFPQFKYGFFPSSIASLGMLKRPVICPRCDSILDVISVESNAILYNSCEKESLNDAINTAYDMTSCERDVMARNLKKHLSIQTWEKVVNIIDNSIKEVEKNGS